MKGEYHKWWSPSVGQDMELKVYGYYGKPVIVFPAQGGRFFEFEDFKMVEAVGHFIDAGKIKLFTVDSLDNQTWANGWAHPADRAKRHQAYDRYILQEVVPFIHSHCGNNGQKLMTTGVSMGAYHTANFFFRHPDVFDTMAALSGLYRLNMFVGDYMDDNVYYNSPLDYLPNMNDPWYLDLYRKSRIIFCVGQGAWEDEMLADTRTMEAILHAKGVPCWVDIWGGDVNHDWPWWRLMLPHVLENLDLPGWEG